MIAGSSCIGQLGVLPARAGTFTALVRFSAANAGDAISVALAGPGGTIDGGPYTLQGGGDGYYYSTFTIGGLPKGEYTLVATRNGTEVAPDLVPARPLRLSRRRTTRSPRRGARSGCRPPRAAEPPAR